MHEPEAARLCARSLAQFLVPPLRTALQASLNFSFAHAARREPPLFVALQIPIPFIGTLFFNSLIEFITLFDFNFNINLSLHVKI